MKSKILILGDGLLGSELYKQNKWDLKSRKNCGFDITDISTFSKLTEIEFGVAQHFPYDTIINCVANTDTYNPEREKHWDVNVKGTKNLIEFCNRWKVKLVHISTSYLYTHSKEDATEEDVPVHCATWYGYTKLISEALVQLECKNHLILRTIFKPTPFPYPKALTSQTGNFDYIDKICVLIKKIIESKATGVYNLGTDKKTIYDLAKKTNPDVGKLDFLNFLTPKDISMNLDKLNKKLNL
tara:strand:+ start:19876 stop:20598 length:723 start_codon:yes stop_codon:yes gene_type:complete